MKHFRLIILFLVSCQTPSLAQIDLKEVLRKLVEPGGDSTVVVVKGSIISDPGLNFFFDEGFDAYLRENVKSLEEQEGRIVIRKKLVLMGDPVAPYTYWFNNFHFTKPVLVVHSKDDYEGVLLFKNCVLEQGLYGRGSFGSVLLQKTTIRGAFRFGSNRVRAIGLDSCELDFRRSVVLPAELQSMFIKGARSSYWGFPVDTLTRYRTEHVRQHFLMNVEDVEQIQFTGNRWYAGDITSLATIQSGHCKDFVMTRDSTQSIVDINNLRVEGSINVSDNRFMRGIVLSKIELPSAANKVRISWEQLQERKLLLMEERSVGGLGFRLAAIYRAETADEIRNSTQFHELTGTYQTLLSGYKASGDLAAMNGCFVELKDLQGVQMKYNYDQYGGFRNYFAWKLNRLLKIYTNHGTDPALAIVMSLYVILVFALIFYFFPSDWDVTGKSDLVRNFRDFITRNDKGYLIPFFKMVSGFLLSLLNAIALSVNAFTTLGFGNIPTRGLARYLCIMEGLIGWFLLSIFTVALINQVSL